jgi:hypothetical protein
VTLNWVLAFGVICLSLSLFLIWHDRRAQRRRVAADVAAVRAMFRMHDVVDADADPDLDPPSGEVKRRE